MRLCALLVCISLTGYCVEKAPLQESGPTPISSQWHSLREKKGVKEWLISCIDSPNALESFEKINTLSLLTLFELKGINDRFDRRVSKVRQIVEKAILDDVEAAMTGQSNDAPVRLLSIGSSGFLQEFFLISQLIKQGKTHIEFTFVKPVEVKKCGEGLKNLRAALLEEGVSLEFKTFSSTEEVQRTNPSPFHAGYGIFAIEQCYTRELLDDVIQARKLITPKSHFIFSQLDGTVALSADAGARVLELTPKARTEANSITATQLDSQRAKDRTIRIVVETSNSQFFFGPMYYALSDLLENGYSDIFISLMGKNSVAKENQSLISHFFESLNSSKSSPLTIQWQPKIYVGDKIQYRKDLMIYWFDNVELKDAVENLNKMIIMDGSSLPDNGHWIIYGKDLGLWSVDGRRKITLIDVPQDTKLLANAMIQDIFNDGHPWWK